VTLGPEASSNKLRARSLPWASEILTVHFAPHISSTSGDPATLSFFAISCPSPTYTSSSLTADFFFVFFSVPLDCDHYRAVRGDLIRCIPCDDRSSSTSYECLGINGVLHKRPIPTTSYGLLGFHVFPSFLFCLCSRRGGQSAFICVPSGCHGPVLLVPDSLRGSPLRRDLSASLGWPLVAIRLPVYGTAHQLFTVTNLSRRRALLPLVNPSEPRIAAASPTSTHRSTIYLQSP